MYLRQHRLKPQTPKTPSLYAVSACTLLLAFLISTQTWPSIMADVDDDLNFGGRRTWQEAFQVLGISWNRDGTLRRNVTIPMVSATPSVTDLRNPPKALSTDVQLSFQSRASVRLYIPVNLPRGRKLPLIINLHGGDFVLYSLSTVIYHEFCNDIASSFPAVVVSVEYRLAPENRLPAAYDDALNAVFWVRNQALGTQGRDPWLEYADFSQVFLLGSGAGGNIVYHVGLRTLDFDLRPIRIRGILMNQPFFGGITPMPSEIRLIDDPYVPLHVAHTLWSLALPRNVNRDHVFCNPISGGSFWGRVSRLPPVFMKADEGDPLSDRSTQLVQLLSSCRVEVVYKYDRGGFHGIELLNKTAAQDLYNAMRNFIITSCRVNNIAAAAADGVSRAAA